MYLTLLVIKTTLRTVSSLIELKSQTSIHPVNKLWIVKSLA